MKDYVVSKPASVRGYALHRLAEGLTCGASPLFADFGDHVVIRTDRALDADARPIRSVRVDQVAAFQLRACVGAKVKGKHRYFHTSDWRSRHDWLARQAERHGFEVVTLHCTSSIAKVEKGDRKFTVDQTDFTGVLKVVDENKFVQAVSNGIGNKARAFGFGMLIF